MKVPLDAFREEAPAEADALSHEARLVQYGTHVPY
jgi:hypothetical protein